MTWSSPLRSALCRAERTAEAERIDDIAWMLGGFAPGHFVRDHADGLPRIQARMAHARVCQSEISTVLRVMTHHGAFGVEGAVAGAIRDILLQNPAVYTRPPRTRTRVRIKRAS